MQKIHIDLQEGQKIWFTSDLHFGHRNVIKFCSRPFADEKEMEKALINNWNNEVGDDDIVFVLGDTFWFNESRTIKKILSQLKGKTIYMIPGNHDEFESYHRVVDPRIVLCQDIVCLWVTCGNKPKREIWLSHYPMMTWPHRENGAWQLFGHIHSNPDRTEGVDQDLPLHSNQQDVGCDFWGYEPVDIRELELYMQLKKLQNIRSQSMADLANTTNKAIIK
jgi:calcineurin-like phosphoesterase family protein